MIALVLAATLAQKPADTAHVRRVWMDNRRSYYMSVEAVFDSGNTAPAPVVILSPDVGNNRDGYRPFSDALARAGYFVLVTTHTTSNCGAVAGRANAYPDMLTREKAAMAIAADPKVAESRDADIAFVLERLEVANARDEEMKGHAKTGDIALVGVGLGGVTALRVTQKPDPRIKAVVAIAWTAEDWAPLAKGFTAPLPVLFLEEGVAAKPEPFDVIDGPIKYLVSTRTERTWIYTGHDAQCGSPEEFTMAPWASEAVADFLGAFLRNDAAARERLDAKSAAQACGEGCRIEAADQRGNKR